MFKYLGKGLTDFNSNTRFGNFVKFYYGSSTKIHDSRTKCLSIMTLKLRKIGWGTVHIIRTPFVIKTVQIPIFLILKSFVTNRYSLLLPTKVYTIYEHSLSFNGSIQKLVKVNLLPYFLIEILQILFKSYLASQIERVPTFFMWKIPHFITFSDFQGSNWEF
jgi:hypothetical protein